MIASHREWFDLSDGPISMHRARRSVDSWSQLTRENAYVTDDFHFLVFTLCSLSPDVCFIQSLDFLTWPNVAHSPLHLKDRAFECFRDPEYVLSKDWHSFFCFVLPIGLIPSQATPVRFFDHVPSRSSTTSCPCRVYLSFYG